MVCSGIVTNVTNFGAFVDIGVHQDGLVHISQLSDKFVKDPKDVVSAGDRVTVRVLEIKLDKKQIALTMKSERGGRIRTPGRAVRGQPSAGRDRGQGGQGGKDRRRRRRRSRPPHSTTRSRRRSPTRTRGAERGVARRA